MKLILAILAISITACQSTPKPYSFPGSCTSDSQCKGDTQCRRTPVLGVGSCQPVGIQASDWLSTEL